MSTMNVRGGAREASISAVVTRADGTVEDLGVISYWNKSPFKRLGWHLGVLLRRLTSR